MDISLSQLQTILTISECGSVTRAAEALNRPQPSVSRTLKEVEEQIGARIFDRSTRAFVLTKHGEVLLRHATSVLAEMSHAELELTGLDQRLENQVRIGVHPIAAASIVIPAVACFRERMPEAHLEIDEGQTQTLLPLLKRGEYDFLVSTVPDEPGASLTFDVLFGSRNGIFVRKQHPLAAVTAPSFEAVTSHPWIYPLPHAHRTKEMENLFSLNAVRRPPVGLSTMSPELSRHALLNNNWVILTQGELLLEELVQGRVVELKTSEVLRDVAIAIAERSATNHSEAAEVLISCIRQEAKNYIKTW